MKWENPYHCNGKSRSHDIVYNVDSVLVNSVTYLCGMWMLLVTESRLTEL